MRSSAFVPTLCLGVLFVFSAIGCGGGGGKNSPPPPTQSVAIVQQPASQTIPIARIATFTVSATGTAPLSYQWSKNGAPIAGATAAAYSTAAIEPADNAATFQVAVSNATSSATSAVATLTVSPRAPAIGDLRYLIYQQVTATGFLQDGGEHTNILPSTSLLATNALGTALNIGSSWACYPGVAYDCAWTFDVTSLPLGQTGLSTGYQGGTYSKFPSDLSALAAPNVVINGLDLEPGNSAYAVAYVQTNQTGGFDYRIEAVSLDQVQATALADGDQGRIVTAISIDANNHANLISYGWQGDRSTVYDAQTVLAQPTEITDKAVALANAGYFISAFGGNDGQGYFLVGMRVVGDTMPRATQVYPPQTGTPPPSASSAPPYFSNVVNVGFNGSGQVIVNEQ